MSETRTKQQLIEAITEADKAKAHFDRLLQEEKGQVYAARRKTIEVTAELDKVTRASDHLSVTQKRVKLALEVYTAVKFPDGCLGSYGDKPDSELPEELRFLKFIYYMLQ